MQSSPSLKKLSLFAVTNLVVGAIVGADVYIVACLGFQYLGPASLVAWMSAGLIVHVASRVMESAKKRRSQNARDYADDNGVDEYRDKPNCHAFVRRRGIRRTVAWITGLWSVWGGVLSGLRRRYGSRTWRTPAPSGAPQLSQNLAAGDAGFAH